MSVVDMLEIGRQGLLAQRRAMHTASHNIANANTPHYSRQKPVFSSIEPILLNGVRVGGGGVQVEKVIRVHDKFIQKQIFDQSKHFGNFKTRSETLRRVEDLIHGGGAGITEQISKFFNDLRELSLNPELPTQRFSVKESALNMANSFNKLGASLEGLQDDITFRLEKSVADINRMAKDLGHLNGMIASFSASGEVPGELFDKQDLIIADLTQKLGYQVERDQLGQVNVIVPGAGILVHGSEAASFEVARTPGIAIEEASRLTLYLKEVGSGKLIPAREFSSGEIGGLMHVRDKVLIPTARHIDRVAFELGKALNAAHRVGVSPDGSTQINFFNELETYHGAATHMKVNEILEKDIEKIAIGYSKDSPGDNRVTLKMIQVQEEKLLPTLGEVGFGNSDRYSIGESMNTIISNVAIQTQSDEQRFENQRAIMEQLQDHRKSVSGVSLEEEAINMVQFQTAFNAAAKTMKVGDEMLQTILGIVD